MSLNSSLATLVRATVPLVITRLIDQIRAILDPYAVSGYSQEGEDMILRRLFDRQPYGFYVDVGAHRPQRFSNACFFSKREWRGINIDPNPESNSAFVRVRPRDINLAVGISEVPGTLRFFQFEESALNTFDEGLARARQECDGYRLLSTINVSVLRLDQVLADHLPAGQEIDFLSVDAEGFDLGVLRSNDWARHRPYCILVEVLQSSLSSLCDHPVHQYISGLKFDLFAKTVNTLIYVDSLGSSRQC